MKTYLIVGSHRASDKLKQLLGGKVDWYYVAGRAGNFALVPNERVADALKIKSIRRANQNQEFFHCW